MLSCLSSFSFLFLQSARVDGTHDEQTDVNNIRAFCARSGAAAEEGNGCTHIGLLRNLIIRSTMPAMRSSSVIGTS